VAVPVDGGRPSGDLSGVSVDVTRAPSARPAEEFPAEALLRAALAFALEQARGPLVLAISGGRDSMALLHATARWAPDRIAAVATFDHGTGQHATDAASLVAAEGRRLGLTVVRERARTGAATEAAWRDARWSFLHRVARAYGARIATAHTRDDQLETVVMRAMRGAGARGLAALAAPSDVVRPWLGVRRAELAEWVTAEGVPFVEDPTNRSTRWLRGRVRHDLLPAFERMQPGFGDALLALAERAAAWRRDVDRFVDGLEPHSVRAGVLRVSAAPLVAMTPQGRAVAWPALFARVGIALDARGTRELIRFTNVDRPGAMLTLARGAMALRLRQDGDDLFELRRAPFAERRSLEWTGRADRLPSRLGAWRFRRVEASRLDPDTSGAGGLDGRWLVALPADAPVRIRRWQAGDRIRTAGARAGRRVTRYFAEAHVPALDRQGWPVVLVEDELVWVPGICRGVAAPDRPGRSDFIWYRCEHD
jgi:tRNA(Ile)-lysidine synthase